MVTAESWKHGSKREDREREKMEFSAPCSPSSLSFCYLLFPNQPRQYLIAVGPVVCSASLLLGLLEHLGGLPQGTRSTDTRQSDWLKGQEGVRGKMEPKEDPGADGESYGAASFPTQTLSPPIKDGVSPRAGGWSSQLSPRLPCSSSPNTKMSWHSSPRDGGDHTSIRERSHLLATLPKRSSVTCNAPGDIFKDISRC